MSLTVKVQTPKPIYIKGERAVWDGKLSCDGSYPSGGYSLPSNFRIKQNFKTVLNVMIEPKSGYSFWFDEDNNKIRVFVGSMEVSNGYDLSHLNDVKITAEGFR